MNLAIAIITAPRPRPTLDCTIRELRNGGFNEPLFVLCEPGSVVGDHQGVQLMWNSVRRGLWGNWLHAARTLLKQTTADFLMVCEDDLWVADDARARLEEACRSLPRSDWGFASLYTPKHNLIGQVAHDGWQDTSQKHLWGALALCFTRESLSALLHTADVILHPHHDGTDYIVSRAMHALGRRRYSHVPSLCAHAGGGNSSSGHSSTAGMEAVQFDFAGRRTNGHPLPLVSCVMVTGDRREFALQSIRYFNRQNYPHRELIIVDDGHDGLAECLPADDRIRYQNVPAGLSIGAKRNLACELARGEFVAFWDDDDWYSPGRLSHQLTPLLEGRGDISALTDTIFFDLANWEFRRCTSAVHRQLFRENVHGGTLMFHRSLWEKPCRFPDVSLAEDARFLERALRQGARLSRLSGDGVFIYIRHGDNAWRLKTGGVGWSSTAEPFEFSFDREFYARRRRVLRNAERLRQSIAIRQRRSAKPPDLPHRRRTAAVAGNPCADIVALTSLSLSRTGETLACLDSWRRAGLQIRAFQHPSELPALKSRFTDLEFVPVQRTSIAQFGRHYIPIKTMLDWAATHKATAFLVNSDIQLNLSPYEFDRIRWLSEGALCYFVRYNHDGHTDQAAIEQFGIDGFLLHGADSGIFADSFLSMGQPCWDYWLPYAFAGNGGALKAVEFPAAFHRRHAQAWTADDHRNCSLELARLSGFPPESGLVHAFLSQLAALRRGFDLKRTLITAEPIRIRDWVERTFHDGRPRTFLELGAYDGADTAWMASIPGVRVFAFEPDSRNRAEDLPNVTRTQAAIGEQDGVGRLLLSDRNGDQPWSCSSSLKRPKHHLRRYSVTFGPTIEVPVVSLDTVYERHGLEEIDFIWADIQGAEREMILGGRRALAATRFLYTEYSNDELYEGQPTLAQILEMLPEFEVRELWPEEVLLSNRRFDA